MVSTQNDDIENDEMNTQPIILRHRDALLLTITLTFHDLFFKSLPAFVAYIMVDYGFSYSFTVTALSFGSLATAATFIVNPLILHLSCNVAFCILNLLQCLACFILYYFRHSQALFIFGVIILSLTVMSTFGCSLTVISTFVTDPNISHKYLSAINSPWTISTFLFLGVGYIMKIGSIWLYLEIMFAIFLLMAILNILILPRMSTNKYNLFHINANLSKRSLVTVSIKNDLSVLFKIKSFWFIMIAILILFMAWGYFYSSFGVWLKQLFNLNQAQFGYIAGLAEGFGNLCAILSVAYLAKSDQDEDEDENDETYKISLQLMMLCTAMIVMISMLFILIICFIGWYNDILLYILIGFFFFGQEACICAALIFEVNIVPPLQQGRASSMIGIVQSVTVFIAQLTVAPIYNMSGMKWESLILVAMYMIAILDIIYLNNLIKQTKLDQELIWINQDKQTVQKYT